MLIPKNYALSNEIAKNAGMHIANFSMLLKDNEDDSVAIKYGACTFINTKSDRLPKYFYKAIHAGKLADLTDYILLSYLRTELECSEKNIMDLKIGEPQKIVVQGKKFVKFNKEFTEAIRDKVITTVDASEFKELNVEGVKLNSKKYMVWY